MQDQAPADSSLIWFGWLDWLIGRSRKTPCIPLWPWRWAGAYYHLPPTFASVGRGSPAWWKERLMSFWRFCAGEQCHGVAVLDEVWLAETQHSLINRWLRPHRRKLLQLPDVAIHELLGDPPANLHYHPVAISNEVECNALVRQADMIHVAYHHFTGRSNLLTKTAHYRIPVIAYPGFLIERRVLECSLGWLAAAETEQDYLDLVLSLNRTNLDRAQADGRWESYLALHNLSKMHRMFAQLLGVEG